MDKGNHLSHYLGEIYTFLISDGMSQDFPSLTRGMEDVLMNIVRDANFLKQERFDGDNKTLAAQISGVLESNKHIFKLSYEFETDELGKKVMVYKKLPVFKEPLGLKQLRKPHSHMKPQSEVKDCSNSVMSSFKTNCLNSTLKFVKNDEQLVLQYPDMSTEQAEFIQQMISQCLSHPGISSGPGSKGMYDPLSEALRIFSIKYEFKLGSVVPVHCDMKRLLFEKIPKKTYFNTNEYKDLNVYLSKKLSTRSSAGNTLLKIKQVNAETKTIPRENEPGINTGVITIDLTNDTPTTDVTVKVNTENVKLKDDLTENSMATLKTTEENALTKLAPKIPIVLKKDTIDTGGKQNIPQKMQTNKENKRGVNETIQNKVSTIDSVTLNANKNVNVTVNKEMTVNKHVTPNKYTTVNKDTSVKTMKSNNNEPNWITPLEANNSKDILENVMKSKEYFIFKRGGSLPNADDRTSGMKKVNTLICSMTSISDKFAEEAITKIQDFILNEEETLVFSYLNSDQVIFLVNWKLLLSRLEVINMFCARGQMMLDEIRCNLKSLSSKFKLSASTTITSQDNTVVTYTKTSSKQLREERTIQVAASATESNNNEELNSISSDISSFGSKPNIRLGKNKKELLKLTRNISTEINWLRTTLIKLKDFIKDESQASFVISTLNDPQKSFLNKWRRIIKENDILSFFCEDIQVLFKEIRDCMIENASKFDVSHGIVNNTKRDIRFTKVPCYDRKQPKEGNNQKPERVEYVSPDYTRGYLGNMAAIDTKKDSAVSNQSQSIPKTASVTSLPVEKHPVSKAIARPKSASNMPLAKVKLMEALSQPVVSERGLKMMRNMGWDGGALGARGDGIVEPLMLSLDLKKGAGFGSPKLPKLSSLSIMTDLPAKISRITLPYTPLNIELRKGIVQTVLDALTKVLPAVELNIPNAFSKANWNFVRFTITALNGRNDIRMFKQQPLNDVCEKILDIMRQTDYIITACWGVSKKNILFVLSKGIYEPSDLDSKDWCAVVSVDRPKEMSVTVDGNVTVTGEAFRYYVLSQILEFCGQPNVTIDKVSTNRNKTKEVLLKGTMAAKQLTYIKDLVGRLNSKSRVSSDSKHEAELFDEIKAKMLGFELDVEFPPSNNDNKTITHKIIRFHKIFDSQKLEKLNKVTDNKKVPIDDQDAPIADKCICCLKDTDKNTTIVEYLFIHKENVEVVSTGIGGPISDVKNDEEIVEIEKDTKKDGSNMTDDVLNTQEVSNINNINPDNQQNDREMIEIENDTSKDGSTMTDDVLHSQETNGNNNIDKQNERDIIETDKVNVMRKSSTSTEDILNSQENTSEYKNPDTIGLFNTVILKESENNCDVSEKENSEKESEHDPLTEKHTGKRFMSNNSTPVRSSKKCKYSESVKKIIIKPHNYPQTEITKETAGEIQKSILESIDYATVELPLLKCNGIQDGGLVYSCHTENSFNFIKNVVQSLGFQVTVTQESLRKRFKITVKINSFIDESVETLFYRFETYYLSLDTKDWEVLNVEKKCDILEISLEIDQESFDLIAREKFTLYAGIDQAKFSVVWD